MLKMVPETPLQFGVAERLSRTFRSESTRIRVEAPKMLWADSVKDVCGEAMKCTFIRSDSDEVRYSFQDTKSHQVIRSRDITFVDSIYEARSATNSSSLMKPIQKSQSPGGSSDTSEGSENSGSFEDSGRLDEEYSEDGALSEEGGFETPQFYLEALSSKEFVQWKKAINEEMISIEKNTTCSLVRLPEGKKASQSLWMFRVQEEQDDRKSCEDDYNQVSLEYCSCRSLLMWEP
ncbi:hypothetical protein Tco_1545351 [Tanacetum coccineum]